MLFVFGSWVLCKTLEVAVHLGRDRKGFDFISMDGDKVEGKGVMKGGYINKNNNMYRRYLAYRLFIT